MNKQCLTIELPSEVYQIEGGYVVQGETKIILEPNNWTDDKRNDTIKVYELPGSLFHKLMRFFSSRSPVGIVERLVRKQAYIVVINGDNDNKGISIELLLIK